MSANPMDDELERVFGPLFGPVRSPYITIQQRIAELARHHGSLRAAARVLNMDPAYLLRLRSGAKDNPSDDTLRRLGLIKVVAYVRKAKP